MLHLRTARRGCSTAAPTMAASCLVWVACTQEAPSNPDRIPPLAIYVRFFCPLLFLALIFHTLLLIFACKQYGAYYCHFTPLNKLAKDLFGWTW